MQAIASGLAGNIVVTERAGRRCLVSPYSPTFLLAPAVLLLTSHSARATDYYVNGSTGSDSNTGTSQKAPYKDFWKANQVMKAGDTVHVAAGTYTTNMYITASGSAGKPINILGDSTNLPVIKLSSGYPIQFAPGVAYVNVKYFNVTTANESGIWAAQNNHHLVISYNVVHDCYGSGIGAWKSDYMTINNNTVYNNAWKSPQEGSGIDLLQSINYDKSTVYHNYIQNNIVYNNANKVPKTGSKYTTDGNGIILDDFRHIQNTSIGPAYAGKTMIQNNLVFNNGGRGIHVYSSDNVTIRNNTAWHNNWDTQNDDYHAGEIETYSAGNVQVYNNIMVSAGAGYSQGAPAKHVAFSASLSSGVAVTADYNLTYGSTAYYFDSTKLQTWGSHNKDANPLFTNASTNAAVADFTVKSSSPALGLSNNAQSPALDILNNPRRSPITDGAYEDPS